MGKKKKAKKLKELAKEPPRFTPLSEIPAEPPTPIKVIPEDRVHFAFDGDPEAPNGICFTQDRDGGIRYHEVDVDQTQRTMSAMQQMKEWIERQYAGDNKVDAALYPRSVDDVLDESFRVEDPDSVRNRFGGPDWREMMKKPGFDTPEAAQQRRDERRKAVGVNDQPAPEANSGTSVHDLVIADMEQRKAFGLEKYGTLLQAGNGRKSLRDAYEEILDLAAYLRCVIEEQEQTDQ